MEKYLITAFLCAGAAAFAALAFFLWRSDAKHLASSEHLLRNRYLGAVLSAAALAWCVPQIQAVAWSSLSAWAWPLAGGALILCILYLDNLAARGLAGLLIMGAYSFLDMSFDCKLNLRLSGAIIPWVWGIIGILIAAKPCYLRDFLNLGAAVKPWRYLAVIMSICSALFLLASVVFYWKVQG